VERSGAAVAVTLKINSINGYSDVFALDKFGIRLKGDPLAV
jgi:hypothetical protein